jgi:hypothetical protein
VALFLLSDLAMDPSPRASPYRVSGRAAPHAGVPPPRVDRTVVAVLACVLGCCLLRLTLFVFGPERLGVDPILALVASAVCAYDLARTLQG